jgi:hypothetical protein
VKTRLYYAKIAAAILMASVTAAALAIQIGQKNAAVELVKLPAKKPVQLKYDPELLDTMASVASQMDLNTHPLAYDCVVSIKDGADTASGTIKQRVLFCKNGAECYYKINDAETLNAGGFYLYIDHSQRRVLLSRQRNIEAPAMGVLSDIKHRMQAEDYALMASVNGSSRTLQLLNEKHISCKSYSITYDTLTRKIASLNVRLSNAMHPEIKSMDKIINMDFVGWPAQSSPAKYLNAGDVFAIESGSVVLREKYKDYQLVNNL